jgi:hypothetical protein
MMKSFQNTNILIDLCKLESATLGLAGAKSHETLIGADQFTASCPMLNAVKAQMSRLTGRQADLLNCLPNEFGLNPLVPQGIPVAQGNSVC